MNQYYFQLIKEWKKRHKILKKNKLSKHLKRKKI